MKYKETLYGRHTKPTFWDNTGKCPTISNTLFHTFFWLKFCFLCSSLLWNGTRCRPWSDCSFRSSLICVYTVCLCHFLRTFSVQNFRTFILRNISKCHLLKFVLSMLSVNLVWFKSFYTVLGRNIPWKSLGKRGTLKSARAISFIVLASTMSRKARFPDSNSVQFTAESTTPENIQRAS